MASAAVPQMSKADREREEQWRAEADCRTLIEAEEIKNDKARYRRALKEARDKAAALKAVERAGK